MPGRGAPPQRERSRPNDTARRAAEFTHVAKTGKVSGPVLPAGIPWSDRTVAWWQTWRESAQAVLFTDTDWDFLLDTAVLHNELWSGTTSVAAELRLRVAKFGASPEDRLRLKLEVDSDVALAKQPASEVDPRKARYLKAVNA